MVDQKARKLQPPRRNGVFYIYLCTEPVGATLERNKRVALKAYPFTSWESVYWVEFKLATFLQRLFPTRDPTDELVEADGKIAPG